MNKKNIPIEKRRKQYEQRFTKITLRLTDKELEKYVDNKRGPLSRPQYIKAILTRTKRKMPGTDQLMNNLSSEILMELKRIGVNINQMARAMNRWHYNNSTEYKEMRKAFEKNLPRFAHIIMKLEKENNNDSRNR